VDRVIILLQPDDIDSHAFMDKFTTFVKMLYDCPQNRSEITFILQNNPLCTVKNVAFGRHLISGAIFSKVQSVLQHAQYFNLHHFLIRSFIPVQYLTNYLKDIKRKKIYFTQRIASWDVHHQVAQKKTFSRKSSPYKAWYCKCNTLLCNVINQ
jgi:hypothetical protein